MHPRASAVSLLSVALLAACSTDVVAPAKLPTSPSFSVSSGTSKRFIVAVNAGKAADLTARVAAAGGQIVAFHEGAGIAIISGLTQDAAKALEAGGIGTVDS